MLFLIIKDKIVIIIVNVTAFIKIEIDIEKRLIFFCDFLLILFCSLPWLSAKIHDGFSLHIGKFQFVYISIIILVNINSEIYRETTRYRTVFFISFSQIIQILQRSNYVTSMASNTTHSLKCIQNSDQTPGKS